MDSEKWTPNLQQSVRMAKESSCNSRNTAKSKMQSTDETELISTQIKEDPDEKQIFQQVKNEFNTPNVIISEKSKQTIQLILSQIKSLSQNDKYLLYLKLPSEVTDIIDPFRQPLNPLGSRAEICRTIVWIRTHLEEDQNISLPKKEVYNEYEQYCDENNIKPLSQADFGKVMKQVFPKVRARRLGQRGNSKYCYSGLRRRVSLEPPMLPELIDKPLSTEAPITECSVAAAWLIIRDWAQQQLGVQFTTLQSLAQYLVQNYLVNSCSELVNKMPSIANPDLQCKETDETATKDLNQHRQMQLQLQKKIQQRSEVKDRKRKSQSTKPEPKPGAKKCRSLSVPVSGITSVLNADHGISLMRTTNGGLTSGDCSTSASSSCSSNSVSPTQGRIICDKPEFTQLTALPDFKSFQKSVTSDSGLVSSVACVAKDNKTSSTTVTQSAPIPITNANGSGNKIAIQRLRQISPKNLVMPIKVQQLQRSKTAKYKSNQSRLHSCDIPTYNNSAATVIQTSTITTVSVADNRSQMVQNEQVDNINDKVLVQKCVETLNECGDDDDFPLTRERLDSVSNVEKDAMDEYLGTNNSQHEEELSKIFNANEVVPPPTTTITADQQLQITADQTSKLSTLRQLLEQNGFSEKKSCSITTNAQVTRVDSTINLPNPSTFPPTITSLLPQIQNHQTNSYHHNNNNMHSLPSLSSISTSTRRRVSFDTSTTATTIPEESVAVPPSPNTRSKNFNFTPISPGPHSPNNGTQSKCSSTTASPFVSPRNTPIPRTKNTTHQNAGIMLCNDNINNNNNRKHVKVKKELSLEIPNEQQQTKNFSPMSAPVSPMLSSSSSSSSTNNNSNINNNKSMLQTLLNSNSKVTYTPEYINNTNNNIQTPSTSIDSTQFFPDLASRSQSVPLLNQIQSINGISTLSNNSQIISDLMLNNKRDPKFDNIQSSCDNNNIDSFNMDVVVSSNDNNQCLLNYDLDLMNSCSAASDNEFPQFETTHHNHKARIPIRSQSIDVDIDFDIIDKLNPSRSVPNTPLPFSQNFKINLINTNNNKDYHHHHHHQSNNNNNNSRSYPSTPSLINTNENFVYGTNNTDCLINGTPIHHTVESAENLDFIQSFQLNDDESNVNDFSVIPNNENLIDESGILMQQGFNDNINQ